jgi:hypothetical protein
MAKRLAFKDSAQVENWLRDTDAGKAIIAGMQEPTPADAPTPLVVVIGSDGRVELFGERHKLALKVINVPRRETTEDEVRVADRLRQQLPWWAKPLIDSPPIYFGGVDNLDWNSIAQAECELRLLCALDSLLPKPVKVQSKLALKGGYRP